MKYAAYGLLAAFLALGVYGAIPTTAEGWYTPSGGFSRQSGSGTVWYFDNEGNERSVSVSVDDRLNVTGGIVIPEGLPELRTAYEALVKACANEAWNAIQDEAIATIGKNLHNLGLADGIDIVGTDPNGNEYRYTMRFTPGSGIRDSLDDGSRPELTDPTAGWNMADEKTLHWRTNNKMELTGADTATTSTDEWWNDYGFFVPFLKGTGALGWKKYGGWYDGVFGTMTSDGRTMLTLAGWTGGHECGTDMNSILTEENGDNRANHYVLTRYGTGSDAVFHYVPFGDRLPNATTNRVEGDEVTISSDPNVPGAQPEEGLKRLGLRGWNYGWAGDPLFLVNQGGVMGYIPLPAITNLAACACTNKWNALLGWIQDGELNGEDGIAFSDSNLDQYLYGTLGYIYSTTADNLYFDNDGEQIQASFTAPENWADGDSVELTESGQYQIKGFADAGACRASVSAMLSDPTGSDATTHLLLAKKTDTGELHYVAIGDGVQSGAAVDDTTITTNTVHGATAQGVASIYGWSGAANDTYLSKNEGGSLEWRKVDPVPGVDDASIVTNTAKQLTLKGYAAAENNAVPVKTEQGLSWLKASSATNVLLAGAGINITDNGGGAITISAVGYGTASGYGTHTVTVVTAVKYDETNHKFQKKTRSITFNGVMGTESGWTDVFETVSHKSEHEAESGNE